MNEIFEYIRGQREAEEWIASLKGDKIRIRVQIENKLEEIHKKLDECIRIGKQYSYLEGWFDTLRHFVLNPSEIGELRGD